MAVVPKQNFRKYFGVEVPAVDFIYEDEQCVVFDEMKNPQAPVHFLVVPKDIIPRLMDTNDGDERLLGHLLTVAKRAAILKGLDKGFRVVMNEGPHSCQSVNQFYVQVLGGRQMWWPFS
ncbi:histidine triad nucleotide-binding protein 2, mitochondrial-like isoform X2 [Hyposmocoma kahamanoa]|uniref:histidine triad nucleotide-binding protein 2, mitochondrial-like isoform X2 n=1 Tax=Hyposmocoma kahamanoa TaxID=1477025 RepID=UPI000E6D78B2|nr:histidine triad nucleotide-binding protein 2, mitochondrial-like isoform X2 [Hyposmocoma kahamanoa]